MKGLSHEGLLQLTFEKKVVGRDFFFVLCKRNFKNIVLFCKIYWYSMIALKRDLVHVCFNPLPPLLVPLLRLSVRLHFLYHLPLLCVKGQDTGRQETRQQRR